VTVTVETTCTDCESVTANSISLAISTKVKNNYFQDEFQRNAAVMGHSISVTAAFTEEPHVVGRSAGNQDGDDGTTTVIIIVVVIVLLIAALVIVFLSIRGGYCCRNKDTVAHKELVEEHHHNTKAYPSEELTPSAHESNGSNASNHDIEHTCDGGPA